MKYLKYICLVIFFISAPTIGIAATLCQISEGDPLAYSSPNQRGSFKIDGNKYLFPGEYFSCRREGNKVFIRSAYSQSGATVYTEIELPAAAKNKVIDVKKAPPSFMDGKTGGVVAVYKEPGIDWKQNKVHQMLGDDKGVAWVPVGKSGYEMEVLDSVMVEDYRDPTLVPEGLSVDEIVLKNQLFYKVKVKYPNETKYREGWVHADFIRYSEMSHAHHDCEKVHPIPKKETEKLSETNTAIKKYIESSRENLTVELANNWTGQCLKKHHTLDWKELPKDAARRIQNAYLEEIKTPAPPTYNGKPLTKTTLLAIDSLARTIYGEMRSCYRRGNGYFKAVARTAVNRAEFDTKNEKARYATTSVRGKSVEEIIPKLFQKDWAYTAWHPADNNIREIICPSTKTKENKEIWEEAVKVSMDAILDKGESLKQSTPNFPYRYYTSGIPNGHKGATEIKQIEVDGISLDSKRCLRVWKI